ncbi:MAG: hypothetical protein K2X03_20635 [Bryobacteraceae bacterium]|nr:hypothetical protein [Bryobacteraceae bacterium]
MEERLANFGIEVVPAGLANHLVLSRDGFVCLLERSGRLGSVCKLTATGFAVIQWDGDQAFFVAKGERQAASPEEIVACRAFARDLQQALG